MLTITQEELDRYRTQVEDTFLDVELKFTKLNSVGYKGKMSMGDELMVYMYLLKEMGNHDFTDDTYTTLVSNYDLYRIVHRANQIRMEIL